MDITEEQILKIALTAIKKYCKLQTKELNGDDVCKNCPFRMTNNWAEYCMFAGPHWGEGVIPEDWELEYLEFMKEGDEEHENE